MPREFHPHVNDSGAPECAYAGCGKEVPSDHYLCVRHYAMHQDGKAGPCPADGCRRFRSLEYEFCADCARAAAPETDPAWASGDEGHGVFYAYVLVQGSQFYAGHTRELRERLWEHRSGDCMATAPADSDAPPRLVWFQEFATREAAAERERELKQLILRDRRAALAIVFRFQDVASLVTPLL